MYEYLKLDTDYFQGLVESLGKAAICEIIIDQVPVNFEKYTRQIEEGLAENDYDKIRRAVHTVKSDFRHFIPVEHEFIKFIQNFEDRAAIKQKEIEERGTVDEHKDFTADLERLKADAAEPLFEISQLGEEYRNAD